MAIPGIERFRRALRASREARPEVILRFPRQLGDVAFTLPFLGGLQRAWNAEARAVGKTIRWVAVGHAMGAALFAEADPAFIAETRTEQGGVGKPDPFRLRRQWREAPPLAVVNLGQSVRLALGAWLAGVPVRAGVADNHLGLLYHHASRYRDLPVHVADRFRPLLRALTGAEDLRWLPLGPEVIGGRGALAKLGAAGWTGRPFVTLAFGTQGYGKRWFPERDTWPELARRLQAAGLDAVWLGGPAEASLGAELAAAVPGSLDLTGRTTIPEAVALQHRAWGNVAVDTGLLHTGAATGRPTVGLFGGLADPLVHPVGPLALGLRGPSLDLEAGASAAFDTHGSTAHRLTPARVLRVLQALADEAREATGRRSAEAG